VRNESDQIMSENLTANRIARQRHIAIRLAARHGISYEDGVRMRDSALRAVIAQASVTGTQYDLVWENLIPGSEDGINGEA
jgi:hypothetical protein